MYILKIIKTNYVTHNVKRFVFEKPKDFVYRPGQAGHFSINHPDWYDKIRPFTFTSLNDWPELELVVKIYSERGGVTSKMGELKAGDELILHDVFDTINYRGPGVFIAGGTGITPFISIFRALYVSNNLRGVALLYSNKTQDDIILGDELRKLLGNAYINVFTRQGVIGFRERHIDRNFLIETIGQFDFNFYVCGPQDFTEDITEALVSLGANPSGIVV